MKRYFELYDKTKTYISPVGEIFNPETVASKYPMVTIITCVIETSSDGLRFLGVDTLTSLKDRYEIDTTLSDSDAVLKIQSAINTQMTETVSYPSADERIAAALEFQNVLSLADNV